MKRSLHFHLLNAFCGIASLFMLCFGGLIAWVATGPRSLDALTPYIESALIPPGSGYKVKIGNSLLLWDGVTHPIGIHVRDLDIIDGRGVTVAHFPDVGLKVYMFRLLTGTLDIKSIELLGPVVKLVQDDKGNISSFGFTGGGSGENNASIPTSLALFTSDSDDNPVSRLQEFIVRNASMSVLDNHGNTFLSSPNSTIEITRKHKVATGKFRMPLQFADKRGDIDSSFTIDGKTKTVESSVVFSEIPSAVLHKLAPTQAWMDGVRVPLSGWADVKSDFDTNINTIDFSLEAGQGVIDFPDQFEKPLNIDRIKFSGRLTEKLTLLTVTEAELDFSSHFLTFRGTVRKQGDDFGVDGDAETVNIPIDDVHRFWPFKLGSHSRRWMVGHVSKGKVIKATAALHYKPGDFKLKDTPEADIDAVITVAGATIVYKSNHPPITDLNGTVRFTGRGMDAKITSAKYLSGTRATSARARFPDFYPDDVEMTIDMDVEAPAKDVQRFLALPDLNKAAKLNLTPQVTGQAKGKGKLDFIAFSENDKDDVRATGKIDYSVSASLIGVSQKRFLGDRDVENANMKFSVDNKGMKTSGRATINEVPMDLSVATSFAGANETTYSVKADMPVAKLPGFGLPKLDFASGSIGADAIFLSSDTAQKASGTLDLTRTDIKLPQHGFFKKAGKKATLKFASERLPNGNMLIKSFTLNEGNDTASGKAEFNRKTGDFAGFSFSPLRIAGNDLESLTYEKAGNTLLVSAQGRTFDATPYISAKNNGSEQGYVIDLRADRLILGPNREFNNAKIKADCPADACRSANIDAKLKDGTAFVYKIEGGALESSCDNAGELVRTLGILDTIDGGKMIMKGGYKGGRLEGVLSVTDYTLKNAPVLTKIFTIASLTGMLEALTSNGVYFAKFTAPFAYHRGIVELKDVRGHGSAMGFTTDGVINTSNGTLDLSGLLVPSYTLNSIVGYIPIIGDLINGGKHVGLLALSYHVHGDMKDPIIHVNPLSVLTPGFLRDIFTIFDKPAPDIDSIEKAQKRQQPVENGTPVTPPTVPAPAPPTSTLPSTDELQK